MVYMIEVDVEVVMMKDLIYQTMSLWGLKEVRSNGTRTVHHS